MKINTQYSHIHTLSTRWKDLDAFGHINNAIFLTYIENARIDLLNLWRINNKSKSIIIASIKIDYINQIKHPAKLIIGQFISRLGETSFDINADILCLDKKKFYAKSKSTCVCFNYATNSKLKVYQKIKDNYKSNYK